MKSLYSIEAFCPSDAEGVSQLFSEIYGNG
jgi:hypothetical protein